MRGPLFYVDYLHFDPTDDMQNLNQHLEPRGAETDIYKINLLASDGEKDGLLLTTEEHEDTLVFYSFFREKKHKQEKRKRKRKTLVRARSGSGP